MGIDVASIDRMLKPAEPVTENARPVASVEAAMDQQLPAAVSSEEVSQAVRHLEQAIQRGPNPDFRLDYLSGLSVVTVRSNMTGEVVFQLPDVRAVELARLIKDGSSLASVGLLNFTA